MKAEQFTYWLQGFAEINGGAPSEEQWVIIKDHLKLVFDKQTPERTLEAPRASVIGPLDRKKPDLSDILTRHPVTVTYDEKFC